MNYKNLFVSQEKLDEEVILKGDVIQLLNDLADTVDSPTESELVNLLLSMVKMDFLPDTAYEAMFDAVDEIIEIEIDDQNDNEYSEDGSGPNGKGYGPGNGEGCSEELYEVDEAQKPLYRRKGYVKCPNGAIRKRGKCGKPIDKKKSRKMKITRRKNKQAYKKGQRKTKITKRRLGQQR